VLAGFGPPSGKETHSSRDVTPKPLAPPPRAIPASANGHHDNEGQAAPLSEKPGDRVGRYKLLQRLGEGGMGVCGWLSRPSHAPDGRLKVIKPGMDSRGAGPFEAERQAWP